MAIHNELIDSTIRKIYEDERKLRREKEPLLVSELYRMQAFDWGGLHQNSLEKTIIGKYVNRIREFDALCARIDNELHDSLRGYVLCSWYNHWTSIIIEDVFRDHHAVLPAVGRVKKIDFFIAGVPFDLKVTYFPEGFISEARRKAGLRPELTLLRQSAKNLAIHFDKALAAARLLDDLWTKHREHPSSEANTLLSELKGFRTEQIAKCQADPTFLIKWLYENQGERRFDASNRLFLVLVDAENFFDSWKLKRSKPLLDARIHSYLDSIGTNPGIEIDFKWDEEVYKVLADTVFVIHPA